MQPLNRFPPEQLGNIRFLLCDVDDTLTWEGRLPSATLQVLEALAEAGVQVIPITGGCAGWTDMMARSWPVAAAIGESGAFWFRYHGGRMERHFWKSALERADDRRRLEAVCEQILSRVPGCRVAGDQPFRLADLAIDIAQDVDPLPWEEVERIIDLFHGHGARARASSIHVNGWFGDYDKLSMALRLLREVYGVDGHREQERILFVGDAPNDAPMFEFFTHTVGVANVRRHLERLPVAPRWVTEAPGGLGFAELGRRLLAAQP